MNGRPEHFASSLTPTASLSFPIAGATASTASFTSASPHLRVLNPHDAMVPAYSLTALLNASTPAITHTENSFAPRPVTATTAAAATPPPPAIATKTRRRRPRTAIHLPEEDTCRLGKEELRKIKNRIAAARARERSTQRAHELEAVVRELWSRVQYVERIALELRPDLSLQELYRGYQPQVQLSPSTFTSPTGAFQAPNATFDLRELAWMFANTEPHST